MRSLGNYLFCLKNSVVMPIASRRGASLLTVSLLATLIFFSVAPAKADTFTFNDAATPDVVTTTPSSDPRMIGKTCNEGEECSFTLVAPGPGYVLLGWAPIGTTIPTLSPSALHIGEPVGSDGPNLAKQSDVLTPFVLGPTQIYFDFNGDGDTVNDFVCSQNASGHCDIFETGGVQTAGTVVWVNPTLLDENLGSFIDGTYVGIDSADGTAFVTDTIQFQSDVPAPIQTPEPSGLLLLSTGLVGLVGVARLKLRT